MEIYHHIYAILDQHVILTLKPTTHMIKQQQTGQACKISSQFGEKCIFPNYWMLKAAL